MQKKFLRKTQQKPIKNPAKTQKNPEKPSKNPKTQKSKFSKVGFCQPWLSPDVIYVADKYLKITYWTL